MLFFVTLTQLWIGSTVLGILQAATTGYTVNRYAPEEEESAKQWLADHNTDASKLFLDVAKAGWKFYTDMTEDNRNNLITMIVKKGVFARASARKALTWDWESLGDAERWQIEKITDIGISATDQRTKLERAVWLETEEDNRYSNSRVKVSGIMTDIIPETYEKFLTTNDISVRADIWRKVHTSYRDIRDLFTERLKLMNEAFQLLGYQDAKDYWTSVYKIHNFQNTIDDIWKQVEPLYRLLHTYVRQKLKRIYGGDESLFPSTGHLSEHVVGSLGSSDWLHIYDAIRPYSNVLELNITKGLRQKVKSVKNLARAVNDIFGHAGLNISSLAFWKDSSVTRTRHTNTSCIPRVLNMYDNDARLQMCGEVDQRSFLSLFGLLGEAAYIYNYNQQPVPFQSDALPGLGSSIGESIALSALTPSNLVRFSIIEGVSDGYKSDVNFLMWMALRILPRLAHDYATGLWKADVYSRYVNASDYNSHWWKLRCKYEGVSAPDVRSVTDFDAGSDIEAWNFVPYFRSFINTVLQFQIHDSFCYQIGHTGALHRCSVLDHNSVGQKLRDMMKLGSSIPWQNQVKAITGDNGLRVHSLLSYFSPLKIWLQGEVSHMEDKTEFGKTCDRVASKAGPSATLSSSHIFFQLFSLVNCIVLFH